MRILLSFCFLLIGISSFAATDQIVVQTVEPELTAEQLEVLNAEVVRKIADKTYLINIEVEDDLERTVRTTKWKSFIVEAEENFEFEYNYVPDDPYYSYQWYFQEPKFNEISIFAEGTWDFTQGGAHTVIAVLDSGVDVNHTDLAPNIYKNYAEQNGQPGVDDDNNGFIDDIDGFNFADRNADVSDQKGHGTGIAGIIGAVGDNGFGISGINWLSSVLPVKISSGNSNPKLSDVIEGIE